MKVSIRPPTVAADNQCFDDDRLNIKFVSHFVDIFDNEEADETNVSGKDTRDKKKKDPKDQKSSSKSRNSPQHDSRQPASNKEKHSSEDQKSSSKSRKSSYDSRRPASNEEKHSKNKNKSSRPGSNWSTSTSKQSELEKHSKNNNRSSRNWSTSTSEQSELENSYDDMRGTSNSNRRTSKTWRWYSSSDEVFDDELSSQSTQPMSSEEDPETSPGIVTDMDSEQSDEQEIVFLYGQLRQITRSPTVNDPADIQLLPTVVVADAEEDRETLSPMTVVTVSPRIVDAVETCTNMSNVDDEERGTVNVSLHDDDDGLPTSSVRSEAVRKAGRAACARATSMQPHRTQPGEQYYLKHLSTNDVKGTPWSVSASQKPDLRASVDDVSNTLSTDDAALVVARRTTPLHGGITSPWLSDQSWMDDRGNGRVTAAAEMSSSSSSSSPLPLVHSHHHQQQQKQLQQPVKRCLTDSTTALSRQPQPDMAKHHSDFEYPMAPRVTADLPIEAAVDQTDRQIIVANVSADPATLMPPLHRMPPSSAPPRQLASCLKYYSDVGPCSTSLAANPQRRRRIRFASEVKQRTFT